VPTAASVQLQYSTLSSVWNELAVLFSNPKTSYATLRRRSSHTQQRIAPRRWFYSQRYELSHLFEVKLLPELHGKTRPQLDTPQIYLPDNVSIATEHEIQN
jgi:hypothetical protein